MDNQEHSEQKPSTEQAQRPDVAAEMAAQPDGASGIREEASNSPIISIHDLPDDDTNGEFNEGSDLSDDEIAELEAQEVADDLFDQSMIDAEMDLFGGEMDPLHVLTLDEAAQYLQVTTAVVRNLIQEGGLPARKIGNGWRLLRGAIAEWLAAGDEAQAMSDRMDAKEASRGEKKSARAERKREERVRKGHQRGEESPAGHFDEMEDSGHERRPRGRARYGEAQFNEGDVDEGEQPRGERPAPFRRRPAFGQDNADSSRGSRPPRRGRYGNENEQQEGPPGGEGRQFRPRRQFGDQGADQGSGGPPRRRQFGQQQFGQQAEGVSYEGEYEGRGRRRDRDQERDSGQGQDRPRFGGGQRQTGGGGGGQGDEGQGRPQFRGGQQQRRPPRNALHQQRFRRTDRRKFGEE